MHVIFLQVLCGVKSIDQPGALSCRRERHLKNNGSLVVPLGFYTSCRLFPCVWCHCSLFLSICIASIWLSNNSSVENKQTSKKLHCASVIPPRMSRIYDYTNCVFVFPWRSYAKKIQSTYLNNCLLTRALHTNINKFRHANDFDRVAGCVCVCVRERDR